MSYAIPVDDGNVYEVRVDRLGQFLKGQRITPSALGVGADLAAHLAKGSLMLVGPVADNPTRLFRVGELQNFLGRGAGSLVQSTEIPAGISEADLVRAGTLVRES